MLKIKTVLVTSNDLAKVKSCFKLELYCQVRHLIFFFLRKRSSKSVFEHGTRNFGKTIQIHIK